MPFPWKGVKLHLLDTGYAKKERRKRTPVHHGSWSAPAFVDEVVPYVTGVKMS